MANTINKVVIYTALLDEIIRAGATSTFMEAGASRVKYNGGGSCMIPKISVSGYGQYDRTSADGYPAGAVVQDWETKLITQDRGVSFSLDAMDEDETAGVLNATDTISVFSKTQAIPEIDSYRYSRIFYNIVNDSAVKYSYYTPAVATLLTEIQNRIGAIQNVIGENEPLVCPISGSAFTILTNSSEITKRMDVQTMTNGAGVTTKIYFINGVKLIPVPSARMKTEYAFGSNGFSAKGWAQDMNFMVMAESAAIGFIKHNKTKVFSAEVNQRSDGDLVQSRTVHDLWVYDNKKEAIFVSLKVATIAPILASTLTTTGATNVTITLGTEFSARDTGHEFYYRTAGAAAAGTAPATYDQYDVSSGFTKITVATAVSVTVTSGYYVDVVQLDENGRAVQFSSKKAA